MPATNQYTFTLYDKTDTTVEGILLYIESAVEEEQWQGAHTLTIRVPVFDSGRIPLHTYNAELTSPYGILNFREKKFIHVYDTIALITKTFIIQQIITDRTADALVYTIICEPRRMKMLAEIVQVNGPYASLTCTQVVDLIVANSTMFSRGTIDAGLGSVYRNFEFRFPTMLAAIQAVVASYSDNTTTYYFSVTDAGVIHITASGSLGTVHTVGIEYRRNLLGLSRNADGSQIVNRVYGAGNDGVLDLRPQSPSPYYSATDSTDITTLGGTMTETLDQAGGTSNPIMVNSEMWVNVYIEMTDDAASTKTAEYKIEFLDSSNNVLCTPVHSNILVNTINGVASVNRKHNIDIWGTFNNIAKMKLTYVTETGAASIVSRKCRIDERKYINGPNTTYVEDTTSQTAHGIHQGAVTTDKPFIYNVMQDSQSVGLSPTFSGTYTAGLHAGCILGGVATGAENSNALYIRSGSRSQKVTLPLSTASFRVGTNSASIVAGYPYVHALMPYSCEVWFYQEEGTVRMRILRTSGTTIATVTAQRGVGWNFFRVENMSTGATGEMEQFSFVFDSNTEGVGGGGAVGCVFYLDSICVHRGVQFLGFADPTTATDLDRACKQYLADNKNPRYTYSVDFLDLNKSVNLIGIENKAANYLVGDKLTVKDEELGISQQLRVQYMSRDLIIPDRTTMQLSDFPPSFGNAIKVTATKQSLLRAKGL